MRLSDFEVLTFDCYGTLIDWERGIMTALRPWLRREEVRARSDEVLEAFGRVESVREAAHPTAPYPVILEGVLGDLAVLWGARASEADRESFGQSVGDWPAFPDTVAALRHLARVYRLVVVSNVDRASFARSNRRLGVTFDAICTAEDVGAYKPDPKVFDYAIGRVADLGYPSARILHVAQSLFHDHVPAIRAGLSTCWIDRRAGRPGSGATPSPDVELRPFFRATGMADLVAQQRAELV